MKDSTRERLLRKQPAPQLSASSVLVEEVLPSLVYHGKGADILELAVARLRGGEKGTYGVKLATNNGRDFLADYAQELIDGFNYLVGLLVENIDNGKDACELQLLLRVHHALLVRTLDMAEKLDPLTQLVEESERLGLYDDEFRPKRKT